MSRFLQQNPLIVLAAVTVITVGLLTAAFWAYTQDDVYITYTYSRNIARGEGFVFNPGERVQGSTTPLYALLMAGVYRITPALLPAGNLLSALFLLATCWLALNFTRRYLSIYARAAIALILATSPLNYVSFGMETLFYTALLMLAFWLWERNQHNRAMLVAAALTWTRADGVVLAGVLGLLALWDAWSARPEGRILPHWRDLPWKLALIYLIGIAPWFIFAWLYFGTPLPNTFSAKQEILHGVKFWVDGWGWWRSFYGNNWLSLLAIPLIGLGMWQVCAYPRLRPLALWAVLYALGYTVLNITAFWYYTPLVCTLTVLAAFGGEWAARKLLGAGIRRTPVIGGATLLVVASSVLAIASALRYAEPPPRVTTYRLLGEWIEQNTSPDSVMLVGDLGIVGYHAQRRTLDVPGLITPDMFCKREEYAVAKYRPDYVVATQYWTWKRLVEQDWFQQYYTPLVQISSAGDDFSPMTVYRRRLPTDIPEQAVQGLDLPLTCVVTLARGEPLPAETHARLFDRSGMVVAEVSQLFLSGQYPESVAIGPETLIEQIWIPLTVQPGSYRWEMDCGSRISGEVEVLPVAQAAGYMPLPGAEWQEPARLRGIAFPDGLDVWSGGSLEIVLDWEARGTPAMDYSIFVHLLTADGQLAAQNDGYPRGGTRPTTTWQTGETIVDVRRLMIPPDLPEGDYQLAVGWYDWRTGDRVLLSDGSDALFLPVPVHNRWPGGSGLP